MINFVYKSKLLSPLWNFLEHFETWTWGGPSIRKSCSRLCKTAVFCLWQKRCKSYMPSSLRKLLLNRGRCQSSLFWRACTYYYYSLLMIIVKAGQQWDIEWKSQTGHRNGCSYIHNIVPRVKDLRYTPWVLWRERVDFDFCLARVFPIHGKILWGWIRMADKHTKNNRRSKLHTFATILQRRPKKNNCVESAYIRQFRCRAMLMCMCWTLTYLTSLAYLPTWREPNAQNRLHFSDAYFLLLPSYTFKQMMIIDWQSGQSYLG